MYYLLVTFRRQFPVEIQEHVVDQLQNDVRSLRQCALTCRVWHFRSRLHLLCALRIGSIKQLHSIRTYFRAHPSLRFLIHSISFAALNHAQPAERPRPVSESVSIVLMRELPNLRRWYLSQQQLGDVNFHPSVLVGLKTHSHIDTLSLSSIRFSTPSELGRLLAALPKLRTLSCSDVEVAESSAGAGLGCAYRRKQVQLRSLVLRKSFYSSPQLLLDLAGGTIDLVSLEVDGRIDGSGRGFPFLTAEQSQAAFAHVRAFEIHAFHDFNMANGTDLFLARVIAVLRLFSPGSLQDIRITLEGLFYPMLRYLEAPRSAPHLASTETTFLYLSPKSLTIAVANTNKHRQHTLHGMLPRIFPDLYSAKLLQSVAHEGPNGHDSNTRVTQVAVSTDSLWTASHSFHDESVILWRTQDGSRMHDWHYPDMVCLEFSQDGRYLCICTKTQVVLRDAQDAANFDIIACIDLGTEPKRCCWSPDGELCAAVSEERALAAFGTHSPPNTLVHLYRTRTADEVLFPDTYLRNRPHTVTSPTSRPSFSHDGRWLLCTFALSTPSSTSNSRPSAWIWDARSSAVRWRIVGSHERMVSALFSPVNYDMVAIGSEHGFISIWDMEARSLVTTLADYTCNPLHMAFSPDGTHIAYHFDQKLRMWNVLTRELVVSVEIEVKINQTVFSPDSRCLALACDDGTVRVWDVCSGVCTESFVAHYAAVTSLALAPNGEFLCTGAADGAVRFHRMGGIFSH